MSNVAAVHQSEGETGWRAGGLTITPVEPMRVWRVEYQGEMILQSEGSIPTGHQVSLAAQYTSDLPFFDFDTDMDAWAMAGAVGREPWSRQFFSELQAAHQSHYEQFGTLEGSLR